MTPRAGARRHNCKKDEPRRSTPASAMISQGPAGVLVARSCSSHHSLRIRPVSICSSRGPRDSCSPPLRLYTTMKRPIISLGCWSLVFFIGVVSTDQCRPPQRVNAASLQKKKEGGRRAGRASRASQSKNVLPFVDRQTFRVNKLCLL